VARRRAVVVGGGISGLAVGEAIARIGAEAGCPVEVVVLEAERSPGGKIQSAREEGFVVDTGPHGFLDKEPRMFALIERLGLTGELVKADERSAKRFVMRAGTKRACSISPRGAWVAARPRS
jgi:oxygen-dependent protoporphyrinogen oxidase